MSDFYSNVTKDFSSEEISEALEQTRRNMAAREARKHGPKSLPGSTLYPPYYERRVINEKEEK